MSTQEPREIYLGNDIDIVGFIEKQYGVNRWNGEPSLTPTGFISDTNTNTAAPIGVLTAPMTAVFSLDGAYRCTIAGSAATTALASYVDQRVYAIIKIGTQLIAYEELIVRSARPAATP